MHLLIIRLHIYTSPDFVKGPSSEPSPSPSLDSVDLFSLTGWVQIHRGRFGTDGVVDYILENFFFC